MIAHLRNPCFHTLPCSPQIWAVDCHRKLTSITRPIIIKCHPSNGRNADGKRGAAGQPAEQKRRSDAAIVRCHGRGVKNRAIAGSSGVVLDDVGWANKRREFVVCHDHLSGARGTAPCTVHSPPKDVGSAHWKMGTADRPAGAHDADQIGAIVTGGRRWIIDGGGLANARCRIGSGGVWAVDGGSLHIRNDDPERARGVIACHVVSPPNHEADPFLKNAARSGAAEQLGRTGGKGAIVGSGRGSVGDGGVTAVQGGAHALVAWATDTGILVVHGIQHHVVAVTAVIGDGGGKPAAEKIKGTSFRQSVESADNGVQTVIVDQNKGLASG